MIASPPLEQNGFHNQDYYLFIDKLDLIQKEYNGFRIISKRESLFCRVIYYTLLVLSFGQLNFYDFETILYKTLYTSDHWEKLPWIHKYIAICHEEVHLRQTKRCFFNISFPIGFFIFMILYIFCLPSVFTFRSLFEREAYRETIRLRIKYRIELGIERIKKNFIGPSYIWMCPFKKTVNRWFDKYQS